MPTTEAFEAFHRPCEDECSTCKVLHDSKHWRRWPGRKLSPKERELVVGAYAEYLESERCVADPERLDPKLIGSKEDPSETLSVVDGSFGGPGKHQTVVLLFAGGCGGLASHAENWGDRLIVLLEKGKRIAAFVDNAPFELRRIDLEGDGLHEVVALGGWAGGGGSSSWVEARSYAGLSPRVLARFDTSSNSCAFNAEDYWESTVLFRWDAKRGSVCFQQTKRTLKCPAPKR